MREQGTVLTASNGELSLEMASTAQCESCGACAAGAGGARILEGVIDTQGAAIGDVVEVETPVRARRTAQALVYVLPVVALVAGYLAGFLLSSWAGIRAADGVGAVVALAFGFGVLLILRHQDRLFDAPSARPRVRAIIARGHDGSATHVDRTGDQFPAD